MVPVALIGLVWLVAEFLARFAVVVGHISAPFFGGRSGQRVVSRHLPLLRGR